MEGLNKSNKELSWEYVRGNSKLLSFCPRDKPFLVCFKEDDSGQDVERMDSVNVLKVLTEIVNHNYNQIRSHFPLTLPMQKFQEKQVKEAKESFLRLWENKKINEFLFICVFPRNCFYQDNNLPNLDSITEYYFFTCTL
jgi:hypothetical protein